MFRILKIVIFTLTVPLVACVNCTGAGCLAKDMLGVWTLFRRDKRFNYKSLWRRLDTCFRRKSNSEVNLWNVSDNFWAGFLEYGIARGSADGTDPWDGTKVVFLENDPNFLLKSRDLHRFPGLPSAASRIVVYEPCNTVSNIAFLWTLLEVCEYDIQHKWMLDDATVRAIIQAISLMTPGSMTLHSSGTLLGRLLDNVGFLMVLVAYQGSIKGLPYDPVTHDIKETPLNRSGIEYAAMASLIIANDPVDEWRDKITALAIPRYEPYFTAFFSSILVLVFPAPIATPLIKLYSRVLLNRDSVDFVMNTYAPAIRFAFKTAGVNPTFRTRLALFSTYQSIAIRLAYAMYWQEQFFPNAPPPSHLTSPIANFAAAMGIPALNVLCNKLAVNERNTKTQIQRARHVYPGDFSCRISQPHSKWHEVTANVFVDVALLSDSVAKVLAGEQLPFVFKNDLFKCYDAMDAFTAFNWTGIETNITDLLAECVSILTDGWPQMDTGNFTGCIVTAILRTGSSKEASTVSPTPNLEDCLIEYDCIQFHNYSGIAMQRLKECIGLSNNNASSPCGSLVQQSDMLQCLLPCQDDDALCLGACLEKNGELSTWLGNTIGCLNILTGSSSANDANAQSLCFREISDPMTQFQSSIVNGLQSMALHSAGTCAQAHLKFVNEMTKFSQCHGACCSRKFHFEIAFKPFPPFYQKIWLVPCIA